MISMRCLTFTIVTLATAAVAQTDDELEVVELIPEDRAGVGGAQVFGADGEFQLCLVGRRTVHRHAAHAQGAYEREREAGELDAGELHASHPMQKANA